MFVSSNLWPRKTLRRFCGSALACLMATGLAESASALATAQWTPSGEARVSLFLRTGTAPDELTGSVLCFEETNGQSVQLAPTLQQLTLLPIDACGRTALDAFDESRPRLMTDLPDGATRLALPRGRGSLYHYSRKANGGTSRFGFLFVDEGGTPHLRGEIFGIGPNASEDPYLPKVGVGPTGKFFLTATKISHPAGALSGDVIEIGLHDDTFVNRSLSRPPLQISLEGLALERGYGTALGHRGIYVFSRAPGEALRNVRFPGSYGHPKWFSGQVLTSNSGSWAMTTAGSTPNRTHVWVYDGAGNAVRYSKEESRISLAGFAGETENGPYWAISNDGKLAAWRSKASSGELFLGRRPTSLIPGTNVSAGAPANFVDHQLTAAGRFENYLDEIGSLRFIADDEVAFLVGEELDSSGRHLADADLFTAKLPTGAKSPALDNVTLSSGQLSPPFSILPALRPERMHWLSRAQQFLMFSKVGTSGELLAIDPDLSGAQILLRDVQSIDFMEVTPSGIMFSTTRQSPEGLFTEMYRLVPDLSAPAALVGVGRAGEISFEPPVVRRDGWASFVSDHGSVERLHRVHLTHGGLHAFPLPSRDMGRALGQGALGSTIHSSTQGGFTTFRCWPFSASPSAASPQATQIHVAPVPQGAETAGFVLPGR